MEDFERTPPGSQAQGPALPMHDVRALVGGDDRAGLILDGVLYILRITRSGKLILTK